MNRFEIQPLHQFTASSSASIGRPKEIACFSYDDAHDFHLDERSLRYYYPPRVGADLSKGFNTFQQLDDSADSHLDSLLQTIIDLEKRTAATPLSDRDIRKYERKLLKFWIQSFLLGVPKIIVGFRSKDGILQSLEELETEKIPRMVKLKGKGSWDGNVCINFTAKFLDLFKVAESGYGDILSKEFIEWRSRPSPQSSSQAGNRATSQVDTSNPQSG
ncbi:MAG: hypothetical protein Q9185_001010 [Variospora sp. 1 TL-2023]